MTLLVHLGYLSYNWEEKTVRTPNKEVATEYVNAIEVIDSFSEVARSVEASKKLLEALIDGHLTRIGIINNEITACCDRDMLPF